jgi:hypothetical protein
MYLLKMECPICFESIPIRKKYAFSCNHCICKPCFRNMSKRGQTTVYDISMVFDASILEFEINRIQCPLCRQDKFNTPQIQYINALNECFPGYIK